MPNDKPAAAGAKSGGSEENAVKTTGKAGAEAVAPGQETEQPAKIDPKHKVQDNGLTILK